MAMSLQDAMANYRLAVMMGASRVRVVRRITVPQAKAGLRTGCTFHVKHGI